MRHLDGSDGGGRVKMNFDKPAGIVPGYCLYHMVAEAGFAPESFPADPEVLACSVFDQVVFQCFRRIRLNAVLPTAR